MHPPDLKDKSAAIARKGSCMAPFVSQHIRMMPPLASLIAIFEVFMA
jgi:hypothetical protein